MESWMLGPPLLIGEKIFYSKDGNNVVPGTVKWLGKILECFGNQMVAGLALDEPIARGGDGSFGARRMFKCPPNHGVFTQLTNVVKQEDFFFANPGYINVMSDRSKYIEKKRDERDLEYTSRHPKPPRSERMEYEAEPREYQAQRYLFQPSLHTDQLHDQNHIDDVPIVEHRQNYRRQSTYQQQSEMEHVYANHSGVMGGQHHHRRRSIGGHGQFYYQNQDFFSTTINESSGGEDHNQSREENVLNNSRNFPATFDFPRNRPPEPEFSSNSSREWDQDFSLHSHPFRKHSLEEVDSSAIRNGNRAFVQNDARGINHGQPSRSNGRQFNSESNLRPNESNNNQNGVGDIMTRLENAIASGNHKEAALLAKEVSKLQISTKLAQKELSKNPKIGPPKQEKINLQMFVEDKTSYNGPISIRVSPKLTVEELKDYINCEFEIPIGVQKWILGKSLVEDEKTTLISHGISKNGQKVFLYLVAPEADKTENTSTENKSQKENNASSESSSAASGEASATETKSNLPPPPDPNRKGRYWNYEMNRWSYCSSDDDDEDEDKPQKGEPEKEVKELKEEIKNAETVNIELQKVEIARENPKPLEDIKEGDTSDYEWEYFYEDVEVKPKADNDEKNKEDLTKSPVPKRLEPLVKPSTSAEANVGTVVNEGATRIIKDAPIPSKEQSAPQPGPSGKTQRVDPRDGWECPSCTFLNEPKRPGCEICTTERPADYVIPPPGPADTIPRNSSISGGKQPVAAGNVKNDNKEPPTLKVVAATVTKAEPPAKAPGAVGGKEKSDQLSNYKKLDDLDIIPNSEEFECLVCFLDIEPGDGVVLRECLHTFCKECLSGAIEHSDAPAVTCPYKDDKYSCDMKLLEREIKALVSPAVFEKHQQKSLKEVQATSKNSFHCKTPDCEGWCFISDNINSFKCPLCKRLNCITCQAIHEGQDCKQYQRAMLNESQDENSIKTKKWIEGLINTGEALNCPSCQVILLKKWGCDWVRCTYCRTEICWVTKQLRWGPNGKGDTSAGCRCMADGRTKCHPLCNYCH